MREARYLLASTSPPSPQTVELPAMLSADFLTASPNEAVGSELAGAALDASYSLAVAASSSSCAPCASHAVASHSVPSNAAASPCSPLCATSSFARPYPPLLSAAPLSAAPLSATAASSGLLDELRRVAVRSWPLAPPLADQEASALTQAAEQLDALLVETDGVLTAFDAEAAARSALHQETFASLHRCVLQSAVSASEQSAALDLERSALLAAQRALAEEHVALREEMCRVREPLAEVQTALVRRCRGAVEELAEAGRVKRVLATRAEGLASLVRGSKQLVKLNVGGRRFETTLGTLCAKPSILGDTLASGDLTALPLDEHGAIFLDRDGAIFHQVLCYLRTGAYPRGAANEGLQRELLVEARLLEMGCLAELLEEELKAIEPRGMQLRRVSYDAAISASGSDFERLLELIYAEAAACASRGKHQCRMAFTQRKQVGHRTFESDVEVGSDCTVSDAAFHRLLASQQTQELLLSRLMEDNMHAQVKSLSKSEAVGERVHKWVSTSTHVLTVLIRDAVQ